MAAKIMGRMRLFFGFLVFSLLAGCSVPGLYMGANNINKPMKSEDNEVVQPQIFPLTASFLKDQKPYQYIIGSYDVLSIIVWDHPELSQPTEAVLDTDVDLDLATLPQGDQQLTGTLVDAKGNIFFPFAGTVKVGGMTPSQVSIELSKRLAKYIKNPQVSVRVAAYRSKRINVIGEVEKPGTQFLTDRPLTLLDAINASGGISKDSADARHIFVFRKEQKAPDIYWVDANSPQDILLAESFNLADNDIVYISEAGVSSWNRVIAQILPTIQTIWYTVDLTR